MEIRVLKYFLAVAHEGSITAAANVLHLTQPTLTRQLQDLEYELKQKLFIRGKHNITLTNEGMLLKDRAEEIIEMVNKTKNDILSSGEDVKGNIYIGCGETEAMKYVAKVIKEVQDSYPNITFHIHSGNAEEVMERLDKKLLDFGVLIQPVDITKYDNITLPTTDTWGVLMRKDSPLAKYKSVKLENFKGLPLITSRRVVKKSQNNDYSNWFQGQFETFNIVATYNLIYNAALLVKSGIGYAIALDKLADTSSESELCFRPFEPKLEAKLDVVWNKFQVRSTAANLFLQKLKEKFGKE
ncbi:MAG: LysR family transcriptional regulator [Alphaproteobacteria bacterium]|nr:LysR family transcriptional regulator [Alphaproteobacteria bacterium]